MKKKDKRKRYKIGDLVWFKPGYFDPTAKPVIAKITKDWTIQDYDYEVTILIGQEHVGPRRNLAADREITPAADLSTPDKVEAFLKS